MTGSTYKSILWRDRQIPAGDDVFMDHIGFFVNDLEQAGMQLQRLGFQVSAINLQSNADASGALKPSGTSNRLALLRRGFIEVLAATHDTTLARQLRRSLERYQGLHLIALSHRDIPGQRKRLIDAGFDMQPIVDLRRTAHGPEGKREIAWSVLRPQAGVMPEGRVQMVLCHTPEVTWPKPSTVHENGSDGLSDVLLCVDDPHEAAARYGRYIGRDAERLDGFAIVATERGRCLFADPTRAAACIRGLELPAVPYMAGCGVRCADIVMARNLLASRGVTTVYEDDELICVGPGDALGSYLLFHGVAQSAPWQALATRWP